MTVLVYVHGTNGSGKSTLARAVIDAAGGVHGVSKLVNSPRATWTHTHTEALVLAGKYGNSCGGVDGIQPYADLGVVLKDQAAAGRSVLAEGLVTPGVVTCQTFANCFTRAVFIHLDTPLHICIRNVLLRRKATGNTKPYLAMNLFSKAQSARSWATRLERVGLEVHRLQYADALRLTLGVLRLPPYN